MASEQQAIEFKFPLKGIDNTHAQDEQPERTCWDARNVVPTDRTSRVRGAQRIGTVKVWASLVPDTP